MKIAAQKAQIQEPKVYNQVYRTDENFQMVAEEGSFIYNAGNSNSN